MEKSLEVIKKCLSEIPYDFAIENKKFVITGNSSILGREEFIEKINQHGGKVLSSISGKTDYLIVCSLGNEDWKYGNFGSKLEKAIELKEQGLEISLIDENVVHEFFSKSSIPVNNFFSIQKQLNDGFERQIFNNEDVELFKFIIKRALSR